MQTFLPYSNYVRSAKILDDKRLGKQRVEVFQILNCLAEIRLGWKNHPAVKMWKGTALGLQFYGMCICKEWVLRGFEDTCYEKIRKFKIKNSQIKPKWLGSRKFHLSHKSNLIRKQPEYYGKFWEDVPNNLPYYRPV